MTSAAARQARCSAQDLLDRDHGPANLRLHNAVFGCLRAAGFSIEMTACVRDHDSGL